MAVTENGKKSEPTDEVNLSKAKPQLAHEEVSSTIQVQRRREKNTNKHCDSIWKVFLTKGKCKVKKSPNSQKNIFYGCYSCENVKPCTFHN